MRKRSAFQMDDSIYILQLYAQGLISKRTAIERLGFVKDADEEMKQIALEHLD